MPRNIQALAAIAVLSGLSSAQSTQFLIDGAGANDRFGQAVAAAGDVNDDGVPDLVVGAPQNGSIFAGGPGYARVHSGVDGSVLLTVPYGGGPAAFGSTVAGLGDLDGDGSSDIAVGAPFDDGPGVTRGLVSIHSGSTGAVLFSYPGEVDGDRLGHTVAAAGDLNGDGVPDFAACAFNSDVVTLNSGTTIAWSGVDGSELHRWEGETNNAHFGVAIRAAGDVNSDGSDDLLVGGLTGDLQLFSGATGEVLRTYPTPSADQAFGASLDIAGDLDGDGWPELLVGAPQTSFFNGGPGFARLLDGASGGLLFEFTGDLVGDEFGTSVAAIGDHDRDGVDDYLVGAPVTADTDRPGYVRIYSGVDGQIIAQLLAEDGTSALGTSAVALGDLDGDGAVDYALGEPGAGDPGIFSGQVLVAAGDEFECLAPKTYCLALPNTSGGPAAIAFSGSNSVAANDLVLQVSGAPAGQAGIFFYGSSRAFAPLSSGIRCVGGQIFRVQPALSIAADGSASTPLDLENLPNPLGQISEGQLWNFQFWFRDPTDAFGGTNLSDALEVGFCP